MKYIYFCYGAAHTSITMANLHLGVLPRDRRPSLREIIHQPLFDRAEAYDHGELRLMGTTPSGDEVYVLGLVGGWKVVGPALQEFLQHMGVDLATVHFEPTLKHAGILLRVGGYTSRALGLVWPGRPLCALGVWLKYHKFSGQVRQVLQAGVRGALP